MCLLYGYMQLFSVQCIDDFCDPQKNKLSQIKRFLLQTMSILLWRLKHQGSALKDLQLQLKPLFIEHACCQNACISYRFRMGSEGVGTVKMEPRNCLVECRQWNRFVPAVWLACSDCPVCLINYTIPFWWQTVCLCQSLRQSVFIN